MKKYENIWVTPKTKRRFKAHASMEGLKIYEYMEKISEHLEDDKRKKKYDFW